MHENAFQSVVWEMAAILSRGDELRYVTAEIIQIVFWILIC